MTATRRTVKVLKKHCEPKLPKEWKLEEADNEVKGMIKEVWELQKQALLDSTTPGR